MPPLHGSLYVTADAIGTATGGGKVTRCESDALELAAATAGEGCEIWQFPHEPRPWGADLAASARLTARPELAPRRAHFYSGTFTRTIEILKARGTMVSYTAAAHDVDVSRYEHERLGLPFDYPHLTDPAQWGAYVHGYLRADLVVCPSAYSARIMKGYGCQRVAVIPHGFDPPARIAPIPDRFVVGYLGQPGPDKGLSYLIEAWSLWSSWRPQSASALSALLVIAGRGTEHVAPLIRQCSSGSFFVRGEVAEPGDLYDACCLYVQPSASEGFGCEVLEARAHGRPVICSDGAGARDFATYVVTARDSSAIARAIERAYERWLEEPQKMIELADPRGICRLTWTDIRARYVELFA